MLENTEDKSKTDTNTLQKVNTAFFCNSNCMLSLAAFVNLE